MWTKSVSLYKPGCVKIRLEFSWIQNKDFPITQVPLSETLRSQVYQRRLTRLAKVSKSHNGQVGNACAIKCLISYFAKFWIVQDDDFLVFYIQSQHRNGQVV